MKRKFLSISCCFFLTLSLMCCSQIKSSLDEDSSTTTSPEDDALLNDALSIDDSEPKDTTSTDNSSNKSSTSSEIATNSSTTEPSTAAENLSSSENAATTEANHRLFFYNSVDKTRYYVDINVDVEENALVSALTSALQNSKYSSDFIILSDKIGVTSATIDPVTNSLTINFDNSFKDYMTLEPADEYELIYTLINTYAYNYGVNKVSLYFNGIQYTSAPSADTNGWYSPYFDSSVNYNKN